MDDDDVDIVDELEDTFNRAAEAVQLATVARGKGLQVGQDILLEIYALFKTATVGKCTDPRPGIFDLRGRAKWTAWSNKSKLSKEAAMAKYITLVIQHYNWEPDDCKETKGQGSASFGGNTVSSFVPPQEDANGELPDTPLIFEWVKDNEIDKVINWLNKPDSPINCQDHNGLSLLHWAVDRGLVDMTQILIDHHADTGITDTEGQTPLDYAITCEHSSIIPILQRKGS